MTKRTFKRIQMLYRDGIGIKASMYAIIKLSNGPTEAVENIILFLEESDSRFVATIEKLRKGE